MLFTGIHSVYPAYHQRLTVLQDFGGYIALGSPNKRIEFHGEPSKNICTLRGHGLHRLETRDYSYIARKLRSFCRRYAPIPLTVPWICSPGVSQ